MSDFEKNYLPLLLKYGENDIDVDNENCVENLKLLELQGMGLMHLSIYVYKSKEMAIRARTSPNGMALAEKFGDE